MTKPENNQDDMVQEEPRVHKMKGDEEVDRYAEDTAHMHVDAVTNKRLFKKVNKRVLVVMLGVGIDTSLHLHTG